MPGLHFCLMETPMPNHDPAYKPRRFRNHPLIASLLSLRGNARACVYTEPLFGIPYSLYMPFFAVYMFALGLDDRMIGIVTSVGFFVQIFTALIGGIVTDRMGRRMATFVFDTFSWSLALLIWAFAQDYRWFLAAAVINAFNQVPNNSWVCLLVEDAEPDKLLHMHTWVNLSGQMAVFFAPLSGLLVSRIGLVPAMRILLLLAFISLTAKFIILFFSSTETSVGRRRMEETANESLLDQLAGFRGVWKEIWYTPDTRLLLFIFVMLNLASTVTMNYHSLFLTQNIGFPEAWLPLIPMTRAVITLIFLFAIQAFLQRFSFRPPLLAGLGIAGFSQLLLILSVNRHPALLVLSIVGDAVGLALVLPQKDVLTTRWVNPQERARTFSLLYVLQLAISTPFAWLTGELSQRNRAGVFVLNMAIYLTCALLILRRKGSRTELTHVKECADGA